jgi:hypothetical protein
VFLEDWLISSFKYLTSIFLDMPDEPVLDWDRVIHKNVRAADGEEPAGTIVVVDNEGVHIESAGDRVHAIIPKSLVSGFNGAQVFLNKPITELGEYIRR